MPIPKPRSDETEQNFIDRFMGDSLMNEEYPEREQRLAVAYSRWREKDIESKGKYGHIDFKPTQAMANAAKRGLEMREKQPPSNRGGTAVGLARANQLVKRETLSPDVVKRMYSFFSRHEVDKQSESWKKGNSKGEQAWLLWGGDSGFTWSKNKVEQMKRADEKKGSDIVPEHKSLELNVLEVKQEGGKGYFKAYLNTYNNVDHGNDMTLKSFGDMNEGAKIPLLLQHTPSTEHGELIIHSDEKGMLVEGKLWLDMVEGTQTPVFEEAWKTYHKLLKGKEGGIPVKFSMGYNVEEKEYENIAGQNVRKLIKGTVMEGSVVTFPMNDGSLQTNQVKEMGGKKMPGMMNMEQMMMMEEAEDKLYKMNRMFSKAMMDTMMNPDMDMSSKMARVNEILAWMMSNYPKACESYMKGYHMEDGMMMKGIEMNLDTKSMTFTIEEKAGAKMSKATMDMMKKAMDAMKKAESIMKQCMGMDMEGDKKEGTDLLETKENDNLNIELKSLADKVNPKKEEEKECQD